MKKKYKLFGLFLLLVFLTLYFTELGNIRYNKTLKYKGHSIDYDQYLRGSRKFSEGHYLSNDMLYMQANKRLALELCKRYRITKNDSIKEKIFLIATEYCSLESRNIDSILRHSADIFNDNIGIE